MPLPEQPDLISLFVAPLNRLGLTYMVTGSLAAGAYGEPRLINDVDLVIALSEPDSSRLHDAFDPGAFYVPPMEVIEAERRRIRHGHFNLIHHNSAFKADVYLVGDDPLDEWALDRREQVMVSNEPVELMDRITVNPDQCGGRPCVRGMRIRVLDVLDLLASGLSAEQVGEELPDLEPADVTACLRFASQRLDHPVFAA